MELEFLSNLSLRIEKGFKVYKVGKHIEEDMELVKILITFPSVKYNEVEYEMKLKELEETEKPKRTRKRKTTEE